MSIKYARSIVQFEVIRQQRGSGGYQDTYKIFSGCRDDVLIVAGQEMGKISNWTGNRGDDIKWVMSEDSTNFKLTWYSQIGRESGRYMILIRRKK